MKRGDNKMSASPKDSGPDGQDFTRYSAEAFKQFQNTKMPNIDFDSIMESHRKNMESLASASQMAAETIRSIAQAQGSYMRQAMEDMASYTKKATASGANMPGQIDAQSRFVRDEIQKAVGYNQEVSDIWNKSQSKLVKLATERLNECVDESNKIIKGAAKKS